MTMAPTVQRHLAEQGIAHEVVVHPATGSSSETAQVAHVSGNRIAKAVVLKDGAGYLLAVLPAAHHLQLDWVRDWLGRRVTLASEAEVGRLFPDCDVGAVPAIGHAYGLDVIVDESLIGLDEVAFEGGDHQSLIKTSGEQFSSLLGAARRGRFSRHD